MFQTTGVTSFLWKARLRFHHRLLPEIGSGGGIWLLSALRALHTEEGDRNTLPAPVPSGLPDSGRQGASPGDVAGVDCRPPNSGSASVAGGGPSRYSTGSRPHGGRLRRPPRGCSSYRGGRQVFGGGEMPVERQTRPMWGPSQGNLLAGGGGANLLPTPPPPNTCSGTHVRSRRARSNACSHERMFAPGRLDRTHVRIERLFDSRPR